MRLLRVVGMTLALLLVAACATISPSLKLDPDATVEVGSATRAFLAELQMRLRNNTTLPDQEYVVCLYGVKQERKVSVDFIRPTKILRATDGWVSYEACPKAPDYLGTWHAHHPGYFGRGHVEDACWFSAPDDRSFQADESAVIDLVSCGEGKLLMRVKRT